MHCKFYKILNGFVGTKGWNRISIAFFAVFNFVIRFFSITANVNISYLLKNYVFLFKKETKCSKGTQRKKLCCDL